MACPNDFEPDFFNNVAAVAMVLIFAKVVAHRSNKHPGPGRRFWHGFAVATAVVAAGAALVATERRSDWCLLHWLAGGFLVLAGVTFIVEIMHDDVWPSVKKNDD
jgi:hypothetical protein